MKRILALLFLISYAGIAIYAFDIPKKPNPERLVNDYSNTLSNEEISLLEQKVVAYDDSSSNQIAIVLINSLDGNDIESFSYQWATEWGIGNKGKNNGVLILCAMQDHKIRIEVGTGLEPRIVDGQAGTIIRKVIGPNFKKGEYFDGLNEAVDEIIYLTSGEFKADPKTKRDTFSLILIGAFVLLIILIIIFGGRGGGGRRTFNNYTYFPGGGFGGFSGGSSSSGGGFGGFGGGGFSGGGSSGSW
jgi:uncharacterized protein